LAAGAVIDGRPTDIVSVGECVSAGAQLQCLTADNTASFTASGNVGTSNTGSGVVYNCDIVVDPIKPIILTNNDPAKTVTDCLNDDRCANKTGINAEITAAVAAKPTGDISKSYVIVVTVVIKADKNSVKLGVDITGDKEPTSTELPQLCSIIASSLSAHVKIDSGRVETCTLLKVTSGTKKRQVSQTTSYVADMIVTEPEAQAGVAIRAVPVAVVAVLAFFFAMF
jgi:hypothetical protein